MKKYFIFAMVFIFTACQGGVDRPHLELIQDMMDGPQFNTQEEDPNNKHDGRSVRVPPKGTIPRGYKPYLIPKNDILSANNLKSPLVNMSADDLIYYEARGQELYEVNCSMCHGDKGLSNGTVSDKMLKLPPRLVDSEYVAYKDGRIFHAISVGYGLMGAYANQIPDHMDRWAVVYYVRQLQELSKGKVSSN